MTIKTLMTAAALIVAPTFAAFASCSGHSQQAMTCGSGSAGSTKSATPGRSSA